jgi:carbamoyltransferase
MITWGISANSHDAALAVFSDDRIVFASHAERFSRIKNDPHLDTSLIQYAKQWGYPEKIVWYENPFLKSLRQLRAGQGIKFAENDIRDYISKYNLYTEIVQQTHHESHAAAGYYTSGFDNATIVVIDSIGEFETFTVWNAEGNTLTKTYSQSYPHSIGLWYSAMTQRIGLKPNEEEYILMGMAAYGDPHRYYDVIKETFFKPPTNKVKFKRNLHKGCSWFMKDSRAFDYTDEPTTWAYDIAAGTQAVYEDLLCDIMSKVKAEAKSNNLVFMGGCALNCKANTEIYDMWDNIWIMPNPGDAGSAIGAVLANKKKHITWPGPYLGYDIERKYDIEKICATLISNGICGVANGKAEFGPRALGNRSLLADPRGDTVRNEVNRIKQRQEFRPFAPAILAEHYDDYFEGPANQYMQFTARCRQPKDYPGIIHADGTSRVQTVTETDNGNFYRLLKRYYQLTGCPMLLNTSLNIKGKPMVNDELDARTFEQTYGVKVH